MKYVYVATRDDGSILHYSSATAAVMHEDLLANSKAPADPLNVPSLLTRRQARILTDKLNQLGSVTVHNSYIQRYGLFTMGDL